MSLFNIFKRDKPEDQHPASPAVNPGSPSALTPHRPATPTPPPPAAPRPQQPAATPAPAPGMDLDRIRGELLEIAKSVGADDASATRSGDDSSSKIQLPLSELMKLAPHAFRPSAQPPAGIKATVLIPDLFDQLTKGKVLVRLSSLLASLPTDARSAEATMHGDELIQLPLALVVANINPTELQKRTAKQEIDRGEKALPNLFTQGTVKKAPAAPTPVGAAATPAATPAPEQPQAIKLPPSSTAAPAPVPAPAATPTAQPQQTVTLPSTPASVVPPKPVAPTLAQQLPLTPPPTPVSAPITVTSIPTPPPPVAFVPPASVTPAVPPSAPAPVAAVPVAPPPAPKPVAPPVQAVAPAATTRSEIEAAQGREEKAAIEAEIEEATVRDTGLLLYGVDINHASAEEMVTRFNGVGRKLAEKIVAHRTEVGLFKDVYDLARVPGVKGKVFQRVTGMAWPAQLFRHREQVAQLLGSTGNDIPDVRGLAQRFKQLEGFTGCIMIDRDGLTLASTWEHPSAEALGAFAPQMFKKLARYVKQLKMGDIRTLTFFADDQPVTLVTSGALLFVAVHKASRFSKRQVELIQALATELGRKLNR